MFILRRIFKDGVEINTCLGEDYVLVKRVENEQEFKRTTHQWREEDMEGIYAVVTYKDGSQIMPLYSGSYYYIMTSDGKTFDNLSER